MKSMLKTAIPAFIALLCVSTIAGCDKGLTEPFSIVCQPSPCMAFTSEKSFEFGEGLPHKAEVVRLESDQNGKIYAATASAGLFVRTAKEAWKQLLGEDSKRRSMLAGVDEYRKVTAFAVSPLDPNMLAVGQKHALLISYDAGVSWNRLKYDFNFQNYITAVGFDSQNRLYVGTSYNGIYRLQNKSFVNISKGLYFEPYAGATLFYDTIAFIKEVKGTLYTSQLFGKGFYKLVEKKWERIDLPFEEGELSHVQDIAYNGSELIISSGEGLFLRSEETGVWEPYSEQNILSTQKSRGMVYAKGVHLFYQNYSTKHKVESKYAAKAAGKKALYTNVHYLEKGSDRLIKILKASKMNAIVIDVKDDTGDIHAAISSEKAEEIGSLKTKVDLAPYIAKFKKEGIYVIARIVVFKDKRLFKAFDSKYAIWDKTYKRPWRAQNQEFWCDAFSDYVRSYNVEIAKKTAEFGFDEIQFDYIRFPADGPLERCLYRYQEDPDTFKSEVLDDFLQEARAQVKAPISVDIYGFTAFYNFGNRIGQDIEVFAKHTDAISAMIYPSHYGYKFYMKGSRERRGYRIVYDTGVRSLFLSNYKAAMRPYLQGFNLKSPTFGTDYIKFQVDAAYDSGCDGFVFWHAGAKYAIVQKALQKQ